MKKNEKPSGYAHVIFLVVTTAVVVGILGFIFWQKSSSHTDQDAASNPTNSAMDHMDNMDMSH